MNEQQTRLLQIASDLLQWSLEMIGLFPRVGEVEKMADVSDADKQKLRKAVEKIVDLFSKVAELSDSQPTANELIEQLIASHDRLREELVKVNQMFDGILMTRTGKP
jgi:hypothetical protein